MAEQKRGALSKTVQEAAKKTLGREITLRELRLMPYVQYQAMNDRKVDPRRVNEEEQGILRSWQDAGYIECDDAGVLKIARPFWVAVNEILFIAYVDLAENKFLPPVAPAPGDLTAKLVDVGRSKINRTIVIHTADPLGEVEKEVRKHLMSDDVCIEGTESPTIFSVVVGGMRTVGMVEFSAPVYPSEEEIYPSGTASIE